MVENMKIRTYTIIAKTKMIFNKLVAIEVKGQHRYLPKIVMRLLENVIKICTAIFELIKGLPKTHYSAPCTMPSWKGYHHGRG